MDLKMALISCPECKTKVSDSAVSCPSCGTPIAEAKQFDAAGSPLTTTQETSKKLKLHTLGSALMIIIGFIAIFVTASPNDAGNVEPSRFPAFMIIIGVVWYIVAKFRIWWHHK